MTIENTLYGPAWVKCANCGVTQPLRSLKDSMRGWLCTDGNRCGEQLLEILRERDAFRASHPELHTQKLATVLGPPDDSLFREQLERQAAAAVADRPDLATVDALRALPVETYAHPPDRKPKRAKR